MLTVSTAALKKIGTTIASMGNSHDDDPCLRMVREDEAGLALSFEPPQESDETYDYQGRTVLAVPRELSGFCEDKTLDVDDSGNLLLG